MMNEDPKTIVEALNMMCSELVEIKEALESMTYAIEQIQETATVQLPDYRGKERRAFRVSNISHD